MVVRRLVSVRFRDSANKLTSLPEEGEEKAGKGRREACKWGWLWTMLTPARGANWTTLRVHILCDFWDHKKKTKYPVNIFKSS